MCYLRPWQRFIQALQYEEIVLFDSRFSREDISFAFDVTYYNFYYFAVISVHLALYTLDCFLSRLYITLTLPALSVSSVQ